MNALDELCELLDAAGARLRIDPVALAAMHERDRARVQALWRARLLGTLKARRAQIFRADDAARERLVADLRVLLRPYPGLRLDVRRPAGPGEGRREATWHGVELVVRGWRGRALMGGEWRVDLEYVQRNGYPDALPAMVGVMVEQCKRADIELRTPYAEGEQRARFSLSDS